MRAEQRSQTESVSSESITQSNQPTNQPTRSDPIQQTDRKTDALFAIHLFHPSTKDRRISPDSLNPRSPNPIQSTPTRPSTPSNKQPHAYATQGERRSPIHPPIHAHIRYRDPLIAHLHADLKCAPDARLPVAVRLLEGCHVEV